MALPSYRGKDPKYLTLSEMRALHKELEDLIHHFHGIPEVRATLVDRACEIYDEVIHRGFTL